MNRHQETSLEAIAFTQASNNTMMASVETGIARIRRSTWNQDMFCK